jgi:hypothetical protein
VEEPAEIPTLAFYYPGWIWHNPAWLKNLLLFFDGVALLVPSYMRDRPEEADPALVAGLRDQDLLTILEPEDLVDATAARTLAKSLGEVLEAGLLDDLEESPMGSISHSRLGATAEPELMASILDELQARGLAGESKDGVSVPIHREVRILILTLLSQILRARGAERGLDLAPATDRRPMQQAFTELLDAPSLPSTGHVFSFDAQAVGVDLSAVGLDEILDFRADHGEEFKAYARGLRGAVAEISTAEEPEQRRAVLSDREHELTETARALASISVAHWKEPAGFMLGLGGAAWSALASDPLGAALSVLGLGVAGLPDRSPHPDAFSYICRAAHL